MDYLGGGGGGGGGGEGGKGYIGSSSQIIWGPAPLPRPPLFLRLSCPSNRSKITDVRFHL